MRTQPRELAPVLILRKGVLLDPDATVMIDPDELRALRIWCKTLEKTERMKSK